jgi:hypothetical protein
MTASPWDDHDIKEQRKPIRGGNEVAQNRWPEVVALVRVNQPDVRNAQCTATLIHPQVVLTAGHCVRLLNKATGHPLFDLRNDPSSWAVVRNVDGQATPGITSVSSQVLKAVDHPSWDGGLEIGKGVDLALLLLEKEFPQGSVARIRTQEPVRTGERAVIVGYGWSDVMGTIGEVSAGRLREGLSEIAVLPNGQLRLVGPARACRTDSGGPVFSETSGKFPLLTGVISFGETTCREGGASYATDITRYGDWIFDHVLSWTRLP